ncbi:hypothetical protein QUC31_001074 [Theobroma cacao]
MATRVGVLSKKSYGLKDEAISHSHDSMNSVDLVSATDHHAEIPTVDYSLLFSDDHVERANALEHLGKACQEFGFFYLVNGVAEGVVEGALKGISDFFDLTKQEERSEYLKKSSKDRIRWGLRSHAGENREFLKVVAHPQYHCPSKPANFRDAIGEYYKRFHEVELGLAKAISKILGYEEPYIEKEFELEAGFDVSAMNLYPPSFHSKGSIGVPDHTDPGLFVSLIQDVNGGLQVLSHNGKWISVNIPRNAIFINLGDHLEILTNGKYKSHIHRVILDNNEVKRISMATLHGPSLDAFVAPAPGFVDESHPPAYRGVTYKESLEFNGYDEIDVQSSIGQLRISI